MPKGFNYKKRGPTLHQTVFLICTKFVFFFASTPLKSGTNYVLEQMGLNFYDYDGLQPTMTHTKHYTGSVAMMPKKPWINLMSPMTSLTSRMVTMTTQQRCHCEVARITMLVRLFSFVWPIYFCCQFFFAVSSAFFLQRLSNSAYLQDFIVYLCST